MNKYNQLREEIIRIVPEIMNVPEMDTLEMKLLQIESSIKGNDKTETEFAILSDNLKNRIKYHQLNGRDITLGDVIICYSKVALKEFKSEEMNEAFWHNQTFNKIIMHWKPNKPLQDQSDECKDLLWDLICKK